MQPRNTILAPIFNVRGILLVEKENYKKAFENFNMAVRLDSDYAQAYHNRGFAYFKLGKYNEALSDFKKAIELNDKDPSIFYHIRDTYCALKEKDKAIEYFTSFLDINPKHAVSYYCRACIYGTQGKFAEIIADLTHTLALEANHQEAKGKLHELLEMNSQQAIFTSIKTLPRNEQIFVLRQAVLPNTLLGKFFRETERPWKRARKTIYEKGVLKDICDYLTQIDPTFVRPSNSIPTSSIPTISVTTNSVFIPVTKPNHDIDQKENGLVSRQKNSI